jgi:hypothetical protein
MTDRAGNHSARIGCAFILAALLVPASAGAAIVANPGAVTFTSNGGKSTIASLQQVDAFAAPNQLTALGTIDQAGALHFPQANITLPVLPGGAAIDGNPMTLATAEATLLALGDADGTLDPSTGAASLSMSVRPVRYRWTGLYMGEAYDATCTLVTSLPAQVLTLTTAAPGTPYNAADGTVALASMPLALPPLDVPAPDACSVSGTILITMANPAVFFARLNNVLSASVPSSIMVAGSLNPVIKGPPSTDGTGLPPTGGEGLPSIPAPFGVFAITATKVFPSKGTAAVTVDVPGPGRLTLVDTAKVARPASSAAVKALTVARISRTVSRAGSVQLLIRPSRAANKLLRKRGSLKTLARLTFAPVGGSTTSLVRSITLRAKKRGR